MAATGTGGGGGGGSTDGDEFVQNMTYDNEELLTANTFTYSHRDSIVETRMRKIASTRMDDGSESGGDGDDIEPPCYICDHDLSEQPGWTLAMEHMLFRRRGIDPYHAAAHMADTWNDYVLRNGIEAEELTADQVRYHYMTCCNTREHTEHDITSALRKVLRVAMNGLTRSHEGEENFLQSAQLIIRVTEKLKGLVQTLPSVEEQYRQE